MTNIFNDLALSQKVFLKVQYGTILEELDLKKSMGQIVRRLKSEGYNLEEADELYHTISDNIEATKILVDDLITDIRKQEMKQDQERAKEQKEYKRLQELRREQDAQKQKEYQQNLEKEKNAEELALEILPHGAIHLLKLFLGG